MIVRLLWDVTRCAGTGCAKKADCLRVKELQNMGPRTPWTERYCTDGAGFIPVKESGDG